MSIVQKVSEKGADLKQLALLAANDRDLICELLDGLKSDKAAEKYGCEKTLRKISEIKPLALYPFYKKIVKLLNHENKILQWSAIYILAHLTAVDDEDKFAEIFKTYFKPVRGPVLITAANLIKAAPVIAANQPELADKIAKRILKVQKGVYDTDECRDIAIGHAIDALSIMYPLLKKKNKIMTFVMEQKNNVRPATRKKTERFLKKYGKVQ